MHDVKPDSSKYLKVVKGMDYCTLLTCTPYGINTKRLLIRGVRVKNPAEKTKDAFHLPLKKVIYLNFPLTKVGLYLENSIV
ncbi:MAG: sortase [Lactobacillus delbrueckii]|nr:sortase [Lactobacillus delbrueckii]